MFHTQKPTAILLGLVSTGALAANVTLSHIEANIRRSVSTAAQAAVVTVAGSEPRGSARPGSARLVVERVVFGELTAGAQLEVPASKFIASDLEPGTRLLVFFHQGAPTGDYELIADGQIREVELEEYLAETKAQAAQMQEARSRRAESSARASAQRQGRKLTVNVTR